MSLLDAAGVVTGDIWCSGAFSFESPLKDLIDSGEYSLEQLLAEDELLQELRGIHPQLIDFFSTEEAVAALVQYVILPPNAHPPKAFTNLAGPMAVKETETEAATATAPTPPTPPTNEGEPQAEGGGDQDSPEEVAAAAAAPSPEGGGEEGKGGDVGDGGEGTGETQQEAEEQAKKDELYVRYPYMACEVICCEIKGIIDIIVDGVVPPGAIGEGLQSVVSPDNTNENAEVMLQNTRPKSILDLLFSMLYNSKPGEIDDYRAGYFDKILSVLFRKRPQAMGQYINEGGEKGNHALMRAMFDHLYSHSIMQIVQRLLLPQPPLPPKPEEDPEKEGDELYSDPLDAAEMDGLGSFRCNWTESDFALELLLSCLIENSSHKRIEENEELSLSVFQNASEVLITIIQNSPLTSPTLHALTSDPVLEKLIVAAAQLDEGSAFSPYDSRLTCTMNVLESLILQLGGYGSVGTVMYGDEEGQDPEGMDQNQDSAEGFEVREGVPPRTIGTRPELATSQTLIRHLPMMLSSLCNLLLSPDSERWLSPMQFSRTAPQKILGSSRLRIVRLLESLVLLGDPNVDHLLCGSNCLEICLDLFWKFQWCSMLHQSVANLLVHVFEGANARAELQSYFLVKCNLLGRLMDSFGEIGEESFISGTESDSRLSEALMAMKSVTSDVPTSSVASERGSLTSKDQPSSEDDGEGVATVKENKSDDKEEAEAQGVTGLSPTQSFRLGYMGHVIIICQALVHACTNDGGPSEGPSVGPSVGGTSAGESRPEANGELGQYVSRHSGGDEYDDQEPPGAGGALHDVLDRGRAADSVVTDETPLNPLILAQLVDTHPLQNRWQHFVTTTLASETAIQSTPLGGFHGSPGGGMDPLHSHRPGMADDGDYAEDDGAAPPLPPRGLLVGGDTIDMDDNDLDVAASMMAGLALGRQPDGDDNDNNRHGSDLLAGIPPQSSNPGQAGNYDFDDPLGDGRFGKFGQDDDDDDDGGDGGSSSDDESGMSGDTGDSGGALQDGERGPSNEIAEAPVMDLFAGNLDAFDGGDVSNVTEATAVGAGDANPSSTQGEMWSDFANFEDAFASTENGTSQSFNATNRSDEEGTDPPTPETKVVVDDDLFAEVKDPASLLEEPERPVEPIPDEYDSSDEEAEYNKNRNEDNNDDTNDGDGDDGMVTNVENNETTEDSQ